jgi:hypothetical protein
VVDDQHTLYNIYHAYARGSMGGSDGSSWQTDMGADMKVADKMMTSNLGV